MPGSGDPNSLLDMMSDQPQGDTMAVGGGGSGYPLSVSPQFGGNAPRVYGWPGQVSAWTNPNSSFY